MGLGVFNGACTVLSVTHLFGQSFRIGIDATGQSSESLIVLQRLAACSLTQCTVADVLCYGKTTDVAEQHSEARYL